MIRLYINAEPVPQPRPRAVLVGSGPKAKPGIIEAPSKHGIHAFKSLCRYDALRQYQGDPLTCPLFVYLVFVMKRPAKRNGRKHPSADRYYHSGERDIDNLQKGVLDVLTGIVWAKDGQIAALSAVKWVAAHGENPHVEVEVRELT